MKHLKYYEALHIPKFNIGDPVKIKNNSTDQFYVIDGYDYQPGTNTKAECRLKNMMKETN